MTEPTIESFPPFDEAQLTELRLMQEFLAAETERFWAQFNIPAHLLAGDFSTGSSFYRDYRAS